MLSQNDIMEELSIANVRAVAACAGFVVAEVRRERDSIDLDILARGALGGWRAALADAGRPANPASQLEGDVILQIQADGQILKVRVTSDQKSTGTPGPPASPSSTCPSTANSTAAAALPASRARPTSRSCPPDRVRRSVTVRGFSRTDLDTHGTIGCFSGFTK